MVLRLGEIIQVTWGIPVPDLEATSSSPKRAGSGPPPSLQPPAHTHPAEDTPSMSRMGPSTDQRTEYRLTKACFLAEEVVGCQTPLYRVVQAIRDERWLVG